VNWQTDLNDPNLKVTGSIDGLNCFIMNSNQSIRWLNGKNINDYRHSIDAWYVTGWNTEGDNYKHDPFATVCKLVNLELSRGAPALHPPTYSRAVRPVSITSRSGG
jgi:hypothetical protein